MGPPAKNMFIHMSFCACHLIHYFQASNLNLSGTCVRASWSVFAELTVLKQEGLQYLFANYVFLLLFIYFLHYNYQTDHCDLYCWSKLNVHMNSPECHVQGSTMSCFMSQQKLIFQVSNMESQGPGGSELGDSLIVILRQPYKV